MIDTNEPLAIRVRDLHCHYQIFQRTDGPRGAGRGLRRRESRAVHALRGISFDLNRGEVLGLIGHNGAGKSTLIRALAGSLVPTSGSVLVSAQPQQLGVGWALNKALSGRKNIRLGLLALQVPRDQIDELVREIEELIDIGEFIDLPMRAYSKGMRARLNFAIATAHAPRILLLDEALSPGDKSFKDKALARVSALRAESGTIVMASHSMGSILDSCDRVLWLKDGRQAAFGGAEETVSAYLEDGGAERNTIGSAKSVEPKRSRSKKRKRNKKASGPAQPDAATLTP